jgi:hypothetical protein
VCSTGAAEDDRAPTEELLCVTGWDFCSTGAVEDGRGPTEELSRVGEGDFYSTETTREELESFIRTQPTRIPALECSL